MLKVENLVTEYGAIRALDGVSFTAAEGKITTVIGANGAGKSTLLRTISGLERAKSGQIIWADNSLIGKAPESIVRSGIAHVPEGRQVFASMTVLENLEMGAYTERGRANWTDNLERIYTWFPVLKERSTQLAGTLSGGEQQRVSIARAILNKPQLILADEPTGNLDPETSEEIMQLLLALAKEENTAILMSSHDITTIEKFQRRIITIADGELKESE